eukprot:scaffold4641_cov117-Isochrysis_galbana.AAC.20
MNPDRAVPGRDSGSGHGPTCHAQSPPTPHIAAVVPQSLHETAPPEVPHATPWLAFHSMYCADSSIMRKGFGFRVLQYRPSHSVSHTQKCRCVLNI